MNITLNIVASDPAELREAISGLAGIVSNPLKPQPEKEKLGTRGATKPEKTGKQPDPEPGVTPEMTATNSEPKPESETENIPTVVELRAKAQEKGKPPEGKQKIKALLDKFQCASISNVPEEKRIAFMHELEALK